MKIKYKDFVVTVSDEVYDNQDIITQAMRDLVYEENKGKMESLSDDIREYRKWFTQAMNLVRYYSWAFNKSESKWFYDFFFKKDTYYDTSIYGKLFKNNEKFKELEKLLNN